MVEVQFYFRAKISGIRETLVLCSLYSPANGRLRQDTYDALNVFEYRGEDTLVVVPAKAVRSVVTMVPFGEQVQGHPTHFFLVEKFALGVVDTGVVLE